jgi:hypothetical protein
MTATRTRMGRPAIPPEAFEHGDPRRYWRGCRCRGCKRGVTAQVNKRAYLRATGRPVLRDPQRAARHADRLRAAGLDDPAIRAAAGLTHDQLRRITRRIGRIHAATELRLLAVPVPDSDAAAPTSRVYVPAHGTVRRLRALVAAGWHATELARRLGVHASYLGHLLRGRGGPHVAWRTDAAVRALYGRLAGLRPEENGVTPGRATRTRATAAAQGWPDPLWWEDFGDIDDPDAPETEQGRQLTRRQLAAVRREEIRHLAAFGTPKDEIAARLGMGRDYVHNLVKTMRKAA